MTSGVLLSGGQDSVAITFWKRPEMAFTLDYGQQMRRAEIRAAKSICNHLDIPHETIEVDISHILRDQYSNNESVILSNQPEWIPFRNQFLATVVAMIAIKRGIKTLISGQVSEDKLYADGTPLFQAGLNQLFKLQEGNLEYDCPSINLSTVELVKKSKIPKALFALAHSCQMSDYPCGNCRSCNKHNQVLEELGF